MELDGSKWRERLPPIPTVPTSEPLQAWSPAAETPDQDPRPDDDTPSIPGTEDYPRFLKGILSSMREQRLSYDVRCALPPSLPHLGSCFSPTSLCTGDGGREGVTRPVAMPYCGAGITERKKKNEAFQETMWQCERCQSAVLKGSRKADSGQT